MVSSSVLAVVASGSIIMPHLVLHVFIATIIDSRGGGKGIGNAPFTDNIRVMLVHILSEYLCMA